MYWRRGSKNPCIGRQGKVVTCRSPKIEGSRGVLIEQRSKHFGIASAIDLRIPEKRPLSASDASLRPVSIKIALSFHSALPP